MLKQKYTGEDEVYFAVLRINIISIDRVKEVIMNQEALKIINDRFGRTR